MKKLVFPVIALIIGLVAGYYFNKIKFTSSKGGGANPFVDISSTEAKFLADNFRDHGLEDVNGAAGGNGIRTRAVWFSYDQIEYIYNLLTDEQENGVGTDGLRFYFGRYPKICPKCSINGTADVTYDPLTQVNRNTVVLVSTKADPNNSKYHVDYYNTTGFKALFMNPVIPPQNRGELCPNNCQGAGFVCPDPNNPNNPNCN